MIFFGNVMHFVSVKTEMEYLKHIQSYKILFNLFMFWLNKGLKLYCNYINKIVPAG